MHLHRHPAEHDQRLAPVDLGLDPRRIDLRDEHLPDQPSKLTPARSHMLTDRDLRDIGSVLINQPPQIRLAVWRCFTGASRSANIHPSSIAGYAPNFGAGRLTGARFAGGTGDNSACFTVGRCTP